MQNQQKLLEKKLSGLQWNVQWQAFDVRHPQTGEAIELKNLIASYESKSARRILIAAHYDTRPFPDRDLQRPRGLFVGANDGASGVALLLELASQLPSIKLNVGVDLVFLMARSWCLRKEEMNTFWDRLILLSSIDSHHLKQNMWLGS